MFGFTSIGLRMTCYLPAGTSLKKERFISPEMGRHYEKIITLFARWEVSGMII